MFSNCSIFTKNSPCYFISHINLQKSFPRDFNINQLEVVEITHRSYTIQSLWEFVNLLQVLNISIVKKNIQTVTNYFMNFFDFRFSTSVRIHFQRLCQKLRV